MNPYITLTEAAARLGVSVKTVRRLVDRGHLIGYRSPARRGTVVKADDVNYIAATYKEQEATR